MRHVHGTGRMTREAMAAARLSALLSGVLLAGCLGPLPAEPEGEDPLREEIAVLSKASSVERGTAYSLGRLRKGLPHGSSEGSRSSYVFNERVEVEPVLYIPRDKELDSGYGFAIGFELVEGRSGEGVMSNAVRVGWARIHGEEGSGESHDLFRAGWRILRSMTTNVKARVMPYVSAEIGYVHDDGPESAGGGFVELLLGASTRTGFSGPKVSAGYFWAGPGERELDSLVVRLAITF